MSAALHATAAREMLACAQEHGFRLAEARLLVPNFHAGAEFARALARESGQSAIVPPRIVTFPSWARQTPVDASVLPDSRRVLLVYHALAGRGWFGEEKLWPVSIALVRLFDEMTRQAVRLPQDVAEFARDLATAYRSRAQQHIAFEARLVHELWFALEKPQGELLGAQAVYALQLAWLAGHADAPLFVLGDGPFETQEQACLEQYAQQQPVWFLVPSAVDAVVEVLCAAWPESLALSLAQRGRQLAQQFPDSPLTGRLALIGARGLEQEALSARQCIRRWLAEGRERIAVVVQDRQSARRLRALLERDTILVADETGWSFDTTVVGALVMHWLEAVRDDFPSAAVQDWLQAPQLRLDDDSGRQEALAMRLRHIVRRQRRLESLSDWFGHCPSDAGGDALREGLQRLQRAGQALAPRRPMALAQRLAALDDSLAHLGLTGWLRADQAGAALDELCRQWQEELADARQPLSFNEFIRWFGQQLQSARFADQSIDSPLVFTHLAATRWRRFDAVLLLGAEARSLPDQAQVSDWFSQQARASLGLPWRDGVMRQTEADLRALLAGADQVCVTWQTERDGQDNPLSVWFDRLDMLHRLAWQVSLRQAPAGIEQEAGGPAGLPSSAPAPAVHPALVPERLSVSAYRNLVACPYRFFVLHVLGLQPDEEAAEEIGKSDYGQFVHEVLMHFHRAHPRVIDLSPGEAEAALRTLSADCAGRLFSGDVMAEGWLQRWLDVVPAYLDWQRQREQAGWFWAEGEREGSCDFPLPEGKRLVLYGRIDRIDQGDGGVALLDYKTSAPASLQQAVAAPGEDVQLAAYALLLRQPVAESLFVAFGEDRIKELAVGEALADAAQCCATRLTDVFSRLHAGTGLPANAVAAQCGRCEARGICRRRENAGPGAGRR